MSEYVTLIIIVFPVIGAIVSLDVTGLTLSQAGKFQEGIYKPKDWAIMHALWHAGLLAVYIIAFTVAINFSFSFLEFLKPVLAFLFLIISNIIEFFFRFEININIDLYINKLFIMIRDHYAIVLGIFTLWIVWTTYSDKIQGEPEEANIEDLSSIARFSYNLFEVLVRVCSKQTVSQEQIKAFLHKNIQAALVAIDMIALAALVKSMGYIESGYLQVVLVIQVFIIVYLFSYITAKWCKNSRVQHSEVSDKIKRKTKEWLVISLRLLEPWFIFYFVLELLGFLLFDVPVHSVGYIFGASLLLFSLISKPGLSVVVQKSLSGFNYRETGHKGRLRSSLRIKKEFCSAAKAVIITLVGFSLTLILLLMIYVVIFNEESNPSLDTLVSAAMFISTLVALIWYFLSPRKLDIWATKFIINAIESRFSYLFFIGTLMIASIVPLYEDLTSRLYEGPAESLIVSKGICQFVDIGITLTHVHVFQIFLWFLFFFLGGVLLHSIDQKYNFVQDFKEGKDVTVKIRELARMLMFALLGGLAIIGYIQNLLLVQFLPCF